MKFLKLVILAAAALPLSGCFTCMTIDKASRTTVAPLPDFVSHVEKASVGESNLLLIAIEARLADASQAKRYTLSVPLNSMQVQMDRYVKSDTSVRWGRIGLLRSAIAEGWRTDPPGAVPVAVGAPITIPETNSVAADLGCYHPLVATHRTVYEIRYENPGNDNTAHLEFAYVDPDAPEKFVVIGTAVANKTSSERGVLFLLPISVPLDVVTLPVQIPLFIIIVIGLATGHQC